MKTNIFNITALALLITTGLIASNNSSVKRVLALQGENMSIANENVLEDISTINYVKAIRVGDEIMPVVDLPELNVTAEYNEGTRVKAKFVNGELMPVVDLPELTIEG
jgi:hypothetical protein